MVIPLPKLLKCERCELWFEDLFNGHVCAVCYVECNTEIMELDRAQDLRQRRQIAEMHKEKR